MADQPASPPNKPGSSWRKLTIPLLQASVTLGVLIAAGFWVKGYESAPQAQPASLAAAPPTSTATPASIQQTPIALQTIAAPAQDTVFIVRTDAAARFLRNAIRENGQVRHGMGLLPLNDVVVVASTEEEAERLAGVLAEGNRMRVSMRQAEALIIDLR